MISAVADLHIASWSWHLCNLPCVYALIYSVARFSYKLCFKVSKYLFSREKNMKLTVKMLFTCILRCEAGPGCD